MIFSKYDKKPVGKISRWWVLDHSGKKKNSKRNIIKFLLSLIPVSVLYIILQFIPLGYNLNLLFPDNLYYKIFSKPEYKIFTGKSGGLYDTTWQILFQHDSSLPFKLEPIHTSGAKDNIVQVSHNGGFGFAQDGLESMDSFNNVKSVIDLVESPLQIVTKIKDNIQDITQLKGKRIYIGATGSGTHIVSNKILNFYGIDSLSYTRIGCNWSFEEGIKGIKNGICDAAFFLLSITSDKLLQIATDSNYTLLDLKRIGPIQTHFPYLKICKIPAGSYGVLNTFPHRDIQTVSMREILICSKDISTKLVWKTIDYINEKKKKANSITTYFSKEQMNLLATIATPLHDGAKSYYSGRTSLKMSDEILVYLLSLLFGQFYTVRNIFKFTRFRILLTRLFDFDPFSLDKNKKRKVTLYPEKRINSILTRAKAWYIQGKITEDQLNKLNNLGGELIHNYKMTPMI